MNWPAHLQLELTNACDLRCRHCHFHGEGVTKERAVGHMAESVWRAALAEIATWNTELTVQPWGMGEPLLHPQLWEVVAVAKAIPRTTVGFYSNGMQWRDEDIKAAMHSRIDWVCFSVDGLDPARFAHFRDGGTLAKVVDTIERLHAARTRRGGRAPGIRINMVAYDEHMTTAESFVERWRGIAESISISRFRPVGSRRFSPIELPRVPCYQLTSLLPVAWDGRVAMCCEDPQIKEPVGTFPESTLEAIWNGERMQAMRAAHRDGRYDVSALCKDCDAWTGIYGRDGKAPGAIVLEKTAAVIYTLE